MSTFEFAFDVKLFATIRVQARTEEEARQIIVKCVSGGEANIGSYPDGSPIVVEVNIDDEEMPCIKIEGEST